MNQAIQIEDTILSQMLIAEYKLLCRFCSRRNEVYKVNALQNNGSSLDFVYKRYIAGDSEREYHFLSKMQGVKIPKVLAKGTNAICLEYIQGPLMLEKLEETEKRLESFHPYLDLLIDFFEQFYKALPSHAYGDINLRNFIIAEDGIYGIDLEETRTGTIAADIGKTAAYLLTYDPAYTPYKKELTDYFICRSAWQLSIGEKDILDNLNMELEYMKIRRRLRNDRKSTK